MSFPNHVGASFKQAAVRSYFSFKVLGGSRESLSGTRRKGCINYIAGIDEEKERKGKKEDGKLREVDCEKEKNDRTPRVLTCCICSLLRNIVHTGRMR